MYLHTYRNIHIPENHMAQLNIFFFSGFILFSVCVCIPRVPGTMELPVTVSHHVAAEDWTPTSVLATSALSRSSSLTFSLLFFSFLFFSDSVSLCRPGCPGTVDQDSVDQAGLKLGSACLIS